MPTTLHIALRFLLAKKRALLMSLGGIAAGVALFIITQAQTAGFEEFFIRSALGADGALRVADRVQDTLASMTVRNAAGDAAATVSLARERRYIEGVTQPSQLAVALGRFENVTGTCAVLRGNVDLDSNFRKQPAQVFGVDIGEYLTVSSLGGQVVFGTLADFQANPKGAVIGALLAARANLNVGDSLVLTQAGRSGRFRVSAIFESGVEHVDKQRVIVHMPEARAVLAQPFGATYLQADLRDRERAPAEAAQMQAVLGHLVEPWQSREKIWLELFRALRASSALTVGAILLIAGLGMFNTLALLVMEKRREIAILRAMGYTRGDVSRVFLLQGALVCAAGALLGCALGALGTALAGGIPLRIRGVFSTDYFVVAWSPWHYVWAVAAAVVVVALASWIPSRRAARIEPGEIIRGAS